MSVSQLAVKQLLTFGELLFKLLLVNFAELILTLEKISGIRLLRQKTP